MILCIKKGAEGSNIASFSAQLRNSVGKDKLRDIHSEIHPNLGIPDSVIARYIEI